MELGGKAANIVFADADLDAAVEGAVFGAYFSMGEECAAAARLLVQEEIADAFNNTGASVLQKENIHKMAEANKAYSHFAW